MCEKTWRFPVVLPLDLSGTPLTSDKSRFVSGSCVRSEKVSGGECEIRLSLFFLCEDSFHFLALQMHGMPLTGGIKTIQEVYNGQEAVIIRWFRCWLAVEIGAGFDWTCVSVWGSVWQLFNQCGFQLNPIKGGDAEYKYRDQSV